MLLAVSVPADSGSMMFWRRDFPGTTDQARVVRSFAAHLLAGFPGLDDVLLVLDELSVNAIRHTRSGLEAGNFTVDIQKDAAGVIVMVSDAGGPGEPCVPVGEELAESGRGLLTVEALAATWSWMGDTCGRTIRATFPVRA
ncbi:anti-sigma regulatory factor (Ser/Thr protein kinase) [Actinomadura pelletieri DSM 43383]|uniref:Anti-sigma regulatory factor (Ser/Thr protein kinase) n=1 Tax=Actinomadura pelletieri DSM 43383 TaxID=1120940 RepID=A0A495QKW8_9ACTN|nr:ATP-binding protein [Actinomadura pelletieri]RKS73194.1 anti-sigma regulatory factor (Ser/Thr protein kinase) [Actinomadura pelletieri DSM 43383]